MKKEPIKVLLVSAVPPPVGGDATWAVEYLEYCKKNGYETKLVNTSISGKRALTTNDSWNVYDEIKRCFRIWSGITKTIKFFSPDVVHLNTNCSPRGVIRDLVSAVIIKWHKKAYVLHCHCSVPDQIGTKSLGNLCLKNLVRLSSRIFVLNSDSLNYLKHLCAGNYEIIPNFIKDELIVQHRVYNQKISRITYIGHIKKTKGIDELLQAAKHFPQIKFILAGPITEDYKKEQIVEQSKGNILLLGSISFEEVNELLDATDIFILPSYTEGFSRALLEAMARGTPIIASDVGANRDMIEDHGGCIIDQKDSSGIVDAIKYMSSPITRATMGEWNVQKVKSLYTIGNVMDRIRSIYQGLIYEKNM